jgi:hypothetical protein
MSQPELIRGPQGFRLSNAARAQALGDFMNPTSSRANVVGFGQGVKWTNGEPTGQPAMLVFVTQKLPATAMLERDLVPPQMDDGTVTDVVAVGHLLAQRSMLDQVSPIELATSIDRHRGDGLLHGDGFPPGVIDHAPSIQQLTRRLRPAPAGVSIGNVAVTAGTLGSVVYDFLPGATTDPPGPGIGIPSTFYLLSTNHILAASNAAPVGSSIVQPGPFDGGKDPHDRIATLTRFVPIQFAPQIPLDRHQNVVDCAIAQCEFSEATREIYFTGAPLGWRRKANVSVGDLVRKTGRTSNLTLGRIIAVEATVDVGYGTAGIARFRDQVITTNLSAGGDSGSLVTTYDNVALGLLFAGSALATVFNYVEHVRAALRVEVAERLM